MVPVSLRWEVMYVAYRYLDPLGQVLDAPRRKWWSVRPDVCISKVALRPE